MRPPTPLDVLDTWWLDPPLLFVLGLSAVLYLGAARRVQRPDSPWPLRRSLAFLGGLGAVALALQSGLDGYAEQMLSIHMVGHLVLLLIAAPLLLAAAPVTLALRALSRAHARGLAAILRGPTLGALGHPITGLAMLGGAMLVTHLTPLFALALTHPLVHVAEHLLYLGAGLLFWAVLIPPGPPVRRLDGLRQVVYLLFGMPLMSVVGVILETDGAARYQEYLAPARRLGISALSDQRLAGTLMWIAGTLLMGAIALTVAWRSLVAEEHRAIARESYADRRERALELDLVVGKRA